ncbi:unnamed protein product [Moneuplotes crassus]|uniref:Uncharacterized protein n=1 Tax=Euplotes crassus TaxID=5936 RepID=A0AAD1U799_EUPCR|nr:unnamed protein product [Moneuplotes crassus]
MLTRRALMENYDAYIFAMKNNIKSLEFNEEGKPMLKRIELFKRLRRIPLDLFRIKIVITSSACYREFQRLIRSRLKRKEHVYSVKNIRKEEFNKIEPTYLVSKAQWDKILINSKVILENGEDFCKLLSSVNKADPVFLKSLYILGKGLIKFKSGPTLETPDFSELRKKKFSRFLDSINRINELYFRGFAPAKFDEALQELQNASLTVESLIVPKEVCPSYSYLSNLRFMGNALKSLQIEYSPQLILQYHLLAGLELETLGVTLENDHIKTFDFEMFDHCNPNISIRIQTNGSEAHRPLLNIVPKLPNLRTESESYTKPYNPDIKFCKFNKCKQELVFFKAESASFEIDLDNKDVVLTSDEGYFYLQTLSNLNIRKLVKMKGDDQNKIKRTYFPGIDSSIINHEFKSDEVLIFPLKYASKFVMDTTHPGCTKAVDSFFAQKSLQPIVKSCKNCEVKLNTSDADLNSYILLVELLPKDTLYHIELSDQHLNCEKVIERLEVFACSKVPIITLAHEKACELLFSPNSIERLISLLYNETWCENLQILQIYCEKQRSCVKLLRAVTQLYNLRELELKWEQGNSDKKVNSILKQRKEIFDKFSTLDVCKI